jgi:putative intracellular protease/amidase
MLTLGLATLTGIVLAGATVTSRSTHQATPHTSTNTTITSLHNAEPGPAVNPTIAPRGRRLVVAFLAGASGTAASDLLAPSDIFASSTAFTTYVVADDATPAALEGGPFVLPTYTFADVDADPTLRPDLVVVPAVGKPTGVAEEPLREWVARQHDGGARVLSVCSGLLVLAATGMLDGLDATSHWSRISALMQARPGSDETSSGGGGFSAALQSLADHSNAATTTATAKMIGYPTVNLDLDLDLDLDNHRRPWRPVLLAIAGLATAALAALGPIALARRRRRRRLQRDSLRTTGAIAEAEAVIVTV